MNHRESLRRSIRTVLSGLLIAAFGAYLSAPRLLVEAPSNWLPAYSAELQSLGKSKAVSDSLTWDADRIAKAQLSSVGSDANNDAGRTSWSVAGFPFDAVHFQSTESTVRYHFAASLIGLNALAIIVVLGGVLGSAYFYDVESPLRFRLGLLWAATAVIFLGGSVWEVVRANEESRSLARYGTVVWRDSVEHPLFQMLPVSVRGPWRHSFSFRQRHPFSSNPDTPGIQSSLTKHPELQVIRLTEHLSASIRKDLSELPFLRTLICEKISSLEELDFVTKNLVSLQSLEVRIDKKATDAASPKSPSIDFRRMTRIAHLSIQGIDQKHFSKEGFLAPSLKTLSIKLAGDDSSTISIHDHANLKELSIESNRRVRSNIGIELVNVPSLRTLATPELRPIDLTIHHAHQLRSIAPHYGDEYGMSIHSSGEAPWFRSLEIRDACSLKAISAKVTECEGWIVERCPNLTSMSISQPSPRWNSYLGVAPDNFDLTPIWDWMTGSLPLNTVDLTRVDVSEVDLSSWKESGFLESIYLSECVTAPGQLKQLAKLESLNTIVAPEIAIDSDTAAELLSSRNDWATLNFNWSELESIRIADQPKLVSAFGSQELRATEIRLENLPRYSADLFILGSPRVLKIENVPLFRSLLVNGTIPSDTNLGELPNLRTFGTRRSKLDDEHVQMLRNSPLLQNLQLPRCSVPQSLVTELSHWSRLVTVNLSRVRVSVDVDGKPMERFLCDEDTTDLANSDSLVVLNLDGSEIGPETVGRLTRCRSLQAISLFNCQLAGEHLLPLSLSDSLLELRVARSAELPSELSDAFEIDRSEQPHETFVSNWNSRAASRYSRRPRRGNRAFEPPTELPAARVSAADNSSAASQPVRDSMDAEARDRDFRSQFNSGRNRFGRRVADRHFRSELDDADKASSQ